MRSLFTIPLTALALVATMAGTATLNSTPANAHERGHEHHGWGGHRWHEHHGWTWIGRSQVEIVYDGDCYSGLAYLWPNGALSCRR